MDAVTTAQRMTADEFLALEPDKRWRRRELIDGEIVVNEPSYMHNRSQFRIGFALEAWIRGGPARGTAGNPLDVALHEHNVFAADLFWYRDGRAPQLTAKAPYPIPDLAVEIRSPSTWRYDIGAKKASYERHGLPELWLVDTAANVVLVFRRSMPEAPDFDVSEELDTEATLTSPLLPGFALAVKEIFPLD
jgi:Uma2 family endonuclease